MRTLSSDDHVIVVGAGLAGWRLVQALRREGFDGALTLIGDEADPPYDRPPLSKQVLVGKWSLDQTLLATDELLAEARVTMRLGVAATGLDVATTTVHLSDHTSVSGSHVVIATGARARRLPFDADRRLHTVRTRSDVARLDRELATTAPGSVIAVIGGGFIGAEVATALHTRGYRVVVLEVAERPLINVLGATVASWLETLASAAGVELRTEQHIRDVLEVDDGLDVVFDDASVLRAALVIVGAGAHTNDEWLATSGLTLDNGVVVDQHCLATDRVAAIGDVARFTWPNVSGSQLARIEHWQIANEHAQALAHFWVTGESPTELLVPYFWSDQYGKKIQLLGHPWPSDDVVRVSGSDDLAQWLALYSRDGVVTGVVTLSHPRALMLSKELLDAPTTLAEALARSPWAR